VPELHFVHDESIERGSRLSSLIEQAVKSDHPDQEERDD
jgi:ribosome-binding factor A